MAVNIVPKEDCIREYVQKKVSQGTAAKALGVSRTKFQRSLAVHGIQSKPHNSKEWHHGRKTKYALLADKAWLERMIKEKSQNEIARMLGTTSGNVSDFIKRHGIRNDLYAEVISRIDESLKIQKSQKTGIFSPNFQGRMINGAGYVYIYCPSHPYANKRGQVFEHRLVMENMIGRFLDPTEVVHHVDHRRQNNDPSNLILIRSNQDHMRYHGAIERVQKDYEEYRTKVDRMLKDAKTLIQYKKGAKRKVEKFIQTHQLLMGFEEEEDSWGVRFLDAP